MSGQNKDFLCDYLVEIKYNNSIKLKKSKNGNNDSSIKNFLGSCPS